MDVFRSMAVATVTELVLVGSFTPIVEDTLDMSRSRRLHTRGHVQTVTAERLDYPVISNWLTSPSPIPLTAPQDA